MSKLSEKNGVEVPIYEWLGKMDWKCRTNDELKGYGRQFSNPIIEAVLVNRISHINSVSAAAAKRAVDILRSTLDRPSVIEANEQFLDLLCDGVTLTIDGKDRTLKIIDVENVWDNDFTVTRQCWVQGVELVKPDLVCLMAAFPEAKFFAFTGTPIPISLNWRLVEAPKNVIDYVILHELLHTRLMSHDQKFWSHLRAICPHAAASREWLERNRPI